MLRGSTIHRSLSALAALPALILGACGTERATSDGTITAFLGARIIDGTGSTPIEQGTIVVRDGRIVAAGHIDHVSIPETADRVDLAGRVREEF